MLKSIFALILLVIVIRIGLEKDIKLNEKLSNVESRSNKCFDCEKDIKLGLLPYMAFPTKCFSCEKQCLNGLETGPTKCLSCGNHNLRCIPIDESNEKNFMTWMRNRFINRK